MTDCVDESQGDQRMFTKLFAGSLYRQITIYYFSDSHRRKEKRRNYEGKNDKAIAKTAMTKKENLKICGEHVRLL